MRTEGHVRSRGLATDLTRAIGWLAIGKVVGNIPLSPERAVVMPVRRSMRTSKLVTVLAAIVGVVRAMFPRESSAGSATS